MTLRPLIEREVKAILKNPAFILSLLLILVLYNAIGQITSSAIKTAHETLSTNEVGIILKDPSDFAKRIIHLANQTAGNRLHIVESIDFGLNTYGMVLIIPEDFTSSVRDTSKYVQLEAYIKMETLSPMQGSTKLSFVNQLGELIRKAIVISVATEQRVDPLLVTKPVIVDPRVKLYEKLMSIEEFSTISQFINLIVLLIAVIIGINSVNAAQFVATEKVEKAFEMLLAQPTPRRNIVIAKITGSTFASLLIGAVYFFGLSSMLSGIFPSSTAAEILYSKLGTGGIYMSLLSIVLGLISSGALGVLIGSIVSDERIASTLAFPIMLVSMGAAFAFSYASLPINTYTGILAGITLSPTPYIILEGFISGNTMLIAITLLTELLFTLVVIVLAMYVYERDIVVLGIKIKGLRVRERE